MIDNLGGPSELGLGGNGVAVAYVFGLRVLLRRTDRRGHGGMVGSGLTQGGECRARRPSGEFDDVFGDSR